MRGRTVLVTGGARGIGYATAVRMIEAGARVMLNDVDGDALDEAVANLVTDDTVVVEAFKADVSELAQIRALVERTVDVARLLGRPGEQRRLLRAHTAGHP